MAEEYVWNQIEQIVQRALIDLALIQCPVEDFEHAVEYAIRELQRIVDQSKEARQHNKGTTHE